MATEGSDAAEGLQKEVLLLRADRGTLREAKVCRMFILNGLFSYLLYYPIKISSGGNFKTLSFGSNIHDKTYYIDFIK